MFQFLLWPQTPVMTHESALTDIITCKIMNSTCVKNLCGMTGYRQAAGLKHCLFPGVDITYRQYLNNSRSEFHIFFVILPS